ncbi:MAG: primase 2 (PriCT-2) family [Rickettsiaceae bacterium]|jgi:putative DNA primase/helicase|nr:primase 2 (PriCT-2) family [Rickettsiaceae bacterium]
MFEQFFAERNVPLPQNPIESGDFTRWGKNNRYSAIQLGDDGIHFEDFASDIKEDWFPKSLHTLSPQEIEQRKQSVVAAKKKAELIRVEQQEKASANASILWSKLLETGDSQYLKRKQVNAYGVSYGKQSVVVPVRDITGKLWSLQVIYHNGNKRFLAGGRKKGCFHVIDDLQSSSAIYLCEGYATGASIYEATGITTVIAFDAGNLEPVIAAIKSQYPNITITIAADNDQWGEVNTGKIKAEEAAEKHDCMVVSPEFYDAIKRDSKPTDFNDLHVLAGLEEVRRQLLSKTSTPTKFKLPPGFTLNEKGLYYDTGKDDAILEWICSPIHVVSYTRDSSNENWGRLTKFKDLDGHTHECAIPMELLSGDCSELYGLLLSLGLRLTTKKTARNKLTEYLQSIKLDKRATCTSRIGWYDNHFILPDGAIPATDEIYLQSDNGNYLGFRTAGTLKEWQDNIALPCQGNSRLIFSISCAFAAPLLPLLHAESGGFNLKGASSIGKSTALAVAASVWGSSKYIQQWKATGNALEAVAEAHNNALLCLDELGQVDGKEAGEIAYMLANGSGKNRLKAKGGLRKKFEWNILFLSTGEISISDKINEAGKKAQAGMLTRMADIPADANKGHRLFDTVHGFKDGNALAHHLKDNSGKYYGTAIRAFLPYLSPVKDQLPAIIKQMQGDFFAQYLPQDADGQVQRVAHRFVLVAAAGELAIKLGILPYAIGEALVAAGVCFQAWLEARGGSGSYEVDEAINQVRAFFEAHHSSRFAFIGNEYETSKDERIINQAGYKRKVVGGYEFLVHTETFNKEICKGFDPQMVKKELAERKLLLRDPVGRYVITNRIPGIGTKRMMQFTPAIFVEVAE